MSENAQKQSVIGVMPLYLRPSAKIQNLWAAYPEIQAIVLIDDDQSVYAFVPANEEMIERFNALPAARRVLFETGQSREFQDWFHKGNFQETRGRAAFYNPDRGLLGNAKIALAPELLGHFGVESEKAQKMVISREGDRGVFKPYSGSFKVDDGGLIGEKRNRNLSISLTPEAFKRLPAHQRASLLAVLAAAAHKGGVGVEISELDDRSENTLSFTFSETDLSGPEGRILLEAVESSLRPPELF